MAILKNQKIEMSWNTANKEYYEQRGYKFTKFRGSFFVKIEDLPIGSGKKIIAECDHCGSKFNPIFSNLWKYRKRRNSNKDCCNDCKHIPGAEKQRKSIIDVKNIIEKTGKYFWIGNKKEYVNTSSKLKLKCLNRHIFKCSIDCFKNRHRKEICPVCSRKMFKIGKSHWNWQGGKTSEAFKIRNSEKYKEWRNLVYKRDSYICGICKIKGGKLEAHHIKPFYKFKKEIFDIANGITLCKKCHRNLHKGKRR